jgi:hypothetical protein
MIADGSSNGLISARCCSYSYMCSWWWMEVPPETCRAVYRNKWTVCSRILWNSYWHRFAMHGPMNIKLSRMAQWTQARWRCKVAVYKGVGWSVSLYHFIHVPWFSGSGYRTLLVTSSGFNGIHPFVFTGQYKYALLRETQYPRMSLF